MNTIKEIIERNKRDFRNGVELELENYFDPHFKELIFAKYLSEEELIELIDDDFRIIELIPKDLITKNMAILAAMKLSRFVDTNVAKGFDASGYFKEHRNELDNLLNEHPYLRDYLSENIISKNIA